MGHSAVDRPWGPRQMDSGRGELAFGPSDKHMVMLHLGVDGTHAAGNQARTSAKPNQRQ